MIQKSLKIVGTVVAMIAILNVQIARAHLKLHALTVQQASIFCQIRLVAIVLMNVQPLTMSRQALIVSHVIKLA